MRILKRVVILAAAWALIASPAFAQNAAAVPETLTLADALRIAEARSPGLSATRALVAIAEADAQAARRPPNPAVSWASEGWAPGTSHASPFLDQQEMYIRVDQEIETAGRRRLRTEAATQSIAASRAMLQNRLRQLQLDVRRAYFQAVLAKTDSEAAKATLDEIDRILEISRTRYRLGEISGGELRRLEVERLKFADDVFAAELAVRNARSGVLALLNVERLDQAFDPVEPLAAPPASAEGALVLPAPQSPLDSAALRRAALQNRPDLVAARREEARAASEIALQRALRTPNVSAGVGYRRDFGSNGLLFGVSVPLPVFGRNPGGVPRAEAERRLAADRLAEAETTVSLEVQQAVNGVEIALARLAYLESQYLKSAREARDAVLAAYRSGAADLLDFLDAQRAFRESQRTYNRALYDHRINLFQLEAAIGGSSSPAATGSGEPLK